MNAADQEAGNRAIDSLINYETVKVISIFRYFVYQFTIGLYCVCTTTVVLLCTAESVLLTD